MTENLEFLEFPKMPRLSREIIITEKLMAQMPNY
jgi:hypothetical protein